MAKNRKNRGQRMVAQANQSAQVAADDNMAALEAAASAPAPVATEAPAPVEAAPAEAVDKAPRRNNFPQFMGKRLTHLGGYVAWPKHVVDTGTRSEELVRANPGIKFEDYIALKGSVSRLCYMCQKGKVKAVAAVEEPVEAPVETAATETPAAAE